MKLNLRTLLLSASVVATLSAFAPVKDVFTPAEQQQISIETPGLFSRSNAFSIDFNHLASSEFSFPLPVGKANALSNGSVEISTRKGDAVKAMFSGVVRLSRKNADNGNVIVIRHDNGLETVYANNAQNLVKVGQHVTAGQTIAIVGSENGKYLCQFSIMVNGGRINAETILDLKGHSLRKQTILCRKAGQGVDVSVTDTQDKHQDDEDNLDADPFENSNTFKWDLSKVENSHWSYPLPGSHVISPYGGRRHHAGVDIKTRPNDEILAAFDGVVTLSGPHYGYGNCIVIRHRYGFETLYSHQSRNFVKVGQKVKAGQVIGLTGQTGRATTAHLHFETHYRGHRFNPIVLFDHTRKVLQNVTLTLTKGGGITSNKN
jgi:murein DD-endopeptidase MepM/ murein hydrolase activator NlpD